MKVSGLMTSRSNNFLDRQDLGAFKDSNLRCITT